jgi:hypothetical protein
VTPDVRMSVLEIRWGITPDMIATQVLPKLVGPDVAKELTWTGREVAGDEAVRIGLATRVCNDPREAAFELAGEIAAKNPAAIRGAKHLIDLSHHADWATGFAEERRIIGSLIGQGLSPFDAASLAVYLHARAGEHISEGLGDAGLMATDLLPVIPRVRRHLSDLRERDRGGRLGFESPLGEAD